MDVSQQTRVVVIGSGGHASVLIDIIEQSSRITIVGLLDDFAPKGSVIQNFPVVGSVAEVAAVCANLQVQGACIAIGDNWSRGLVYRRVRQSCPDLEFVQSIHPRAVVSRTASISAGVAIMPGAIVGPNVKIGPLAIVNTGATVDHDCELGPFSSVGPRAALAGRVHLGEFAAVGIGATVREQVTIENQVVIGAGALVLRDIPSNTVAFGSPARVIRQRRADESYLRTGALGR